MESTLRQPALDAAKTTSKAKRVRALLGVRRNRAPACSGGSRTSSGAACRQRRRHRRCVLSPAVRPELLVASKHEAAPKAGVFFQCGDTI
jgi:hypothetical protein